MFAGNIGMHVLESDTAVTGDQVTETGAIEDRAGADDAIGWEAGDGEGYFADHVDGVGDHEQDSVGGDPDDFGEEFCADGSVCLGQVEAGLAWLLFGSRCHDDNVGILENLDVIGTVEGGCGSEEEAMVEVENLCIDLRTDDIKKADLVGDAANHGRIGNGGSDAACANDADFGGAFGSHGRIHLLVGSTFPV